MSARRRAPWVAVLLELRVRDLGVIDDVTVELAPGMTALTGETGAGKTLLVEALEPAGRRPGRPVLVRAGADEALVEGRFVVGPRRSSRTDGIILARAGRAARGRSRAWVDGRMASDRRPGRGGRRPGRPPRSARPPVPLGSDAQRRRPRPLRAIDLGRVRPPGPASRRSLARVAALGGDPRQRAREVDLLRFQVDEIDGAGIDDADEDGRLEDEEERLAEAATHRGRGGRRPSPPIPGTRGRAPSTGWPRPRACLAAGPPLAELDGRVALGQADAADLAAELRHGRRDLGGRPRAPGGGPRPPPAPPRARRKYGDLPRRGRSRSPTGRRAPGRHRGGREQRAAASTTRSTRPEPTSPRRPRRWRPRRRAAAPRLAAAVEAPAPAGHALGPGRGRTSEGDGRPTR